MKTPGQAITHSHNEITVHEPITPITRQLITAGKAITQPITPITPQAITFSPPSL